MMLLCETLSDESPVTPGFFHFRKSIVTPGYPYSNGVLMNDIHERPPILLFMKAVTKKQVWIPGFTKRSGQVVQGHFAMVNVSTDHDEHKAVAGQGNYTEQQAHKKLSKKDWFNGLSHEHKVSHILKEATAIQAAASMTSRSNSLKKKILAGEKPTPGEWKAFDSLSNEKQAAFIKEFEAAGKGDSFGEQWFDYSAANPKHKQAPQAVASPEPKPEPTKAPEASKEGHKSEPEAKPTPSWLNPAKPSEATTAHLAAESKKLAEAKQKQEPKPEPAAKEDGSDAVLAKIEAAKAKLPADHHITPGQTKKLDVIKAALQAGDAKSILMHAYPTHTYGKQAAKLANEALAAIGSKHTVTAGQKMGEHAALKDDAAPAAEHKPEPAAEPAKVVAADDGPKEGDTKEGADGTLALKDGHWVKQGGDEAAAGALSMPDFTGGKNDDPKFVDYYKKVAQKVIDHAQAGNASVLEDMKAAGLTPKNGKVGNTWKGKTANSKKLLELYDAALAHAKGNTPAMESAPADIPSPDKEIPKPVTDALLAHPEGMSPKTWDDVAKFATAGDKAALVEIGKQHNGEMKMWIADVLVAMGEKPQDASAAVVDKPAPAAPKFDTLSYEQAANQIKEWADAGKTDELLKMATLKDAVGDMGKLKDYAAALYEHKTGEKPKGETALPEKAAAASNELPVPPTSANGQLSHDAYAAAKAGDMQAVKDIHAYAEKNGFENTKDYVSQLIAAMPAAAAPGKPEPSSLNAMPADGSMPAAPASIDASVVKVLQKWAKEGPLSHLENYAKPSGDKAMDTEEKYAAQLVDWVHAQSAAAETAAASNAMPEPHAEANLDKFADAIKSIKDMGKSGDTEALLGYAKSALESPHPSVPELGKYAQEVAKWVESQKAEPAAAAPVKPSVFGYTVAVNDIEEEYKKGVIGFATKGWASENADLNPELEKVVKYANEVIAALGGTPPNPAAIGDGPKEGDTKMGADGMLVFQNGRWHKQGGEQPAKKSIPPEIAIKTVAKPKFEGKNAVKMNKTVKELQAIAQSKGVEGLKAVVMESVNKPGATKIGGPGISGFWTGLVSPNGKLLAAYAHSLIAAMEGATVAPASTPAPKPAQKVTGTTVTATESVDGWKQVGPQGGYNPGGTYEDKDGQKWYVKFPAGGEKVAKNELVATKLYALAGVEVPEVKLINQNGKIGLASKIIDGAVANKSALLEGKAQGLLQGFGADAWLANWDAVGNNPAAGKGFDNILFKPDGSAVRIDAGGALLYGGAGGKKQKFENEVTDLQTMLDPSKNANTAAVFGKMSAADIAASIAKVAAIPDHEIEGVVMEFGPGSESEKTRLAEKLIARKQNMVEQFPSAAKGKKGAAAAAKPKLDPSALPVDASLLPTPHDFMNWQGTGKAISEKPYVKGNIADEQEILNIALQGNLTALKDYKFQPVDKMTGEAIGEKKSIDEHPSKYVQDFHNTIVSYLDMLANPPEALRPFETKSASTLASLSAAFKPHDFGKTTSMAPKNQQLGFWIALGVAESPAKFVPKTLHKLSTAAISKAKDMHSKLPGSVKSFISGVQGSGSYNNPYRDGKETDHGGNKTREVLTDLYNNATAHTAGTTISKWISFAPEMVKQFQDAPEGLVFQNPGSMCTSYNADATKHFGKDRITIHYAEGAKALDSFASGSFASEMEVTTLPGARFMVLSRKMVPDVEHGKPNEKRFELEVLMLPPDPTYVDNLLKKA